MTITLNNSTENITAPSFGLTIKELLSYKEWSFPLIIFHVNGKLVEKAKWDSFYIKDGDNVDAHHLISGG